MMTPRFPEFPRYQSMNRIDTYRILHWHLGHGTHVYTSKYTQDPDYRLLEINQSCRSLLQQQRDITTVVKPSLWNDGFIFQNGTIAVIYQFRTMMHRGKTR